MKNQPTYQRPEAANEYTVSFPSKHNRLGSASVLPIMYSLSASPQQTRSSIPLETHLRIKGLCWSDINAHRPTHLQQIVDGLLVSAFLILLMFFWLVLPELLAA